jgi:endonuclease III
VMWNMMAFEFYDKVDSNMQKRMDEMKVILNEKVKAMLPSPVDESSVEYKQLYNSIREKSRDFHYVIIMAISGSSSDTNTRNCYERLMLGKLDSLSFLKDIGRVKNFMMFFEGLVEIMRRYSLYVSGALAVITIAVTSVVDCDGDIPRGSRLTSIEQMLDKKARITENTKAMFTHDMKDFIGIGLDTHVKRVLKILIYLYLTKHTNKTISMNDAERYAFIVADWIDPTIGVYCNEVLAQLGQYMDSKSAECKEILDAVFKKVSGDDPLYKEAIKMWQGK